MLMALFRGISARSHTVVVCSYVLSALIVLPYRLMMALMSGA
jgi:hypothetical protein